MSGVGQENRFWCVWQETDTALSQIPSMATERGQIFRDGSDFSGKSSDRAHVRLQSSPLSYISNILQWQQRQQGGSRNWACQRLPMFSLWGLRRWWLGRLRKAGPDSCMCHWLLPIPAGRAITVGQHDFLLPQHWLIAAFTIWICIFCQHPIAQHNRTSNRASNSGLLLLIVIILLLNVYSFL